MQETQIYSDFSDSLFVKELLNSNGKKKVLDMFHCFGKRDLFLKNWNDFSYMT